MALNIASIDARYLSDQDSDWSKIRQDTLGAVFLATPHRGSDWAISLDVLLKAFGAKKRFVTDLLPNSRTIDEISNFFARHCKDMIFASYGETVGIYRLPVHPILFTSLQ